MIPTLIAAALVTTTGLALVVVALRERTAAAELDAYLDDIDEGRPLDDFEARLGQPLFGRLVRPIATAVVERLGRLLPANHLAIVRHKLVLAGVAGRVTAEEYVAFQALALVAGIGGGILVTAMAPVDGPRAVAVGVLLGGSLAAMPWAWLSRTRDGRVRSIERDLPDVLDLLAISVEAGVGFEAAIEGVIERFDSPLAHELGHALSEMELGVSRRDALRNLATRTEVTDLSAFVLALIQADALGTPVSRTLKIQADEMRRRRRQTVREAAAKLPVKILFPLICFVMPSLFVVILGPAAIRIMEAF